MNCQNPLLPKVRSLTSKTDEELVDLIKRFADSDAFLEVCRRYENIFYKVCQKYSTYLAKAGLTPQDAYDEKNYIIYHCICSFSPEKKTKLSTWIGNYARYLCLNSINSRRFIVPTDDNDIKNKIEEHQVVNEYVSSGKDSGEDFNYIINILSQIKDKRIHEVFNLRYFSPKKMIWSSIASKMGVSTQTAINLHNKGVKILKKKIKSKNISDII